MNKNALNTAGAVFLLGAMSNTALSQEQIQEQAQEQENTPEITEEVVVVGIRASIQSAISAKRNANSVVEVIAAEDIGKLPEFTIVESLARLPGLSSGRDRGNGSGLSVRGLGTDLTGSLLNGRELATHNASRSPRFDQFPSELINGASVYKSPVANQMAGGVAGTIDLKTVKPLAMNERRVVLNANFEYQEIAADLADGESFGDRESISYVDQFMDGELGVAIGLANSTRPIGTVRAAVFNPNPTAAGNFTTEDGTTYSGVTFPYGFETSVRTGEEKRQGLITAIQWAPSENFEANYDLFLSQFDIEENQGGFRTGNLTAPGTRYGDVVVAGGTFDSATNTQTGGSVTAATITGGFDVNNVNEIYEEKDDLLSTGLNLKWATDNSWTIGSDIAYSRAERKSFFLSIETAQVQPTARFDGTHTIPAFAFHQDLLDTDLNQLVEIQEIINDDTGGAQNVVDRIGSVSLDFAYDFDSGSFTSVEFGTRFSSREKEYVVGNQTVTLVRDAVVEDAYLTGDPLGSFDGNLATAPQALRFDVDAVLRDYFNATIQPQQDGNTRRRGWVIEEDIGSLYAQVNFEKELGSMLLSGNFGVRYEATKTTAGSVLLVNTDNEEVETPIEVDNDFNDVLPALNLSLDINDKQKMRFSAARALTRPPIDDLNPGAGVFVFDTADSFGGNPLLEPFRSNQIDITYEFYFDNETAVTIAYFYKDLSTIIVNQTRPQDVDLDGDGQILNPNPDGRNETGTITQPVNLGEATISGVELAYNQSFTFLPEPFDGLGVYATVSFNESDMVVEEAFSVASLDFPGFADSAGNFTLWYSKGGFETRVAYRFTDDFVRRVDGQALAVNEAEAVVDMQASYYFTDNFQVLLQAKNLTNDPYTTNHGDPRLHGRYEQFGRTYSMGASYTF